MSDDREVEVMTELENAARTLQAAVAPDPHPMDWHQIITEAEEVKEIFGLTPPSVWEHINNRDYPKAREAMIQIKNDIRNGVWPPRSPNSRTCNICGGSYPTTQRLGLCVVGTPGVFDGQPDSLRVCEYCAERTVQDLIDWETR